MIFNIQLKWEHKNKCFQLSFLLPVKGKGCGGIDHYTLDEKNTMQLLSDPEGCLSFILVLQSLGFESEFITPLLSHAGLLAFKDKMMTYYESGYSLGDSSRASIKSLMDFNDQSELKSTTPIVPKVTGLDNTNYGKFLGRKYAKSEGEKLTEKDLTGVRQTMSYLLAHNSCVVITLNIPLCNDKRSDNGAIPQIVMPYWWAETIKAMRLLNQKHCGQGNKGLHKSFVQQLLDQSFKTDSDMLPHSYPHPDSFIG
jgi:hypothetical protein